MAFSAVSYYVHMDTLCIVLPSGVICVLIIYDGGRFVGPKKKYSILSGFMVLCPLDKNHSLQHYDSKMVQSQSIIFI